MLVCCTDGSQDSCGGGGSPGPTAAEAGDDDPRAGTGARHRALPPGRQRLGGVGGPRRCGHLPARGDGGYPGWAGRRPHGCRGRQDDRRRHRHHDGPGPREPRCGRIVRGVAGVPPRRDRDGTRRRRGADPGRPQCDRARDRAQDRGEGGQGVPRGARRRPGLHTGDARPVPRRADAANRRDRAAGGARLPRCGGDLRRARLDPGRCRRACYRERHRRDRLPGRDGDGHGARVSDRFDVLAVGETMLSLVAEDGPLATATSFRATHGGAESNACVALARAGLRVAWISRLGDDHAGDRIRQSLAREVVDLRWVATDPVRPTGAMFRDRAGGLSYLRAGSAASALDARDLDDVPVEAAGAVLVTGITAMLGPGPQRAAIALLDRASGIRVVDPNLRPGLWGSDRAVDLIRPLVRRCDVLIGGEDELGVIAPGPNAEEIARGCAALGPTEVVVKRGAAGLAAVGPDGVWREHPPVPVVEHDPVGAGDACNAAYLAARLDGADIGDALKAGAVAGAAAAGVLGDTGTAP